MVEADKDGEAMNGLTLRDFYAAAALAGFLSNGSQRLIADALENGEGFTSIQDPLAKASVVNHELAAGCFAVADMMLHVRGEEQSQ